MSKLSSRDYDHYDRYGEMSRYAKQDKVVDFDYCEEYLKGLHQTKYYYGSVKHIFIQFWFADWYENPV